MFELKRKYQDLKSKLINPGQETSIEEVMINDMVEDEIEELFKDVPKSTIELIKLNHV